MQNSKSSNKSFGIVFGVFFAIIFIYNFFKYSNFNLYVLLTSVFFFIFAYLYPKIFTPLNIIWTKFGDLLGKFIAPLVMFFVYFSVVFATSLVLKVFNKDILNLKINKNSKTFWKIREQNISDMNKQF